MTDSKLRPTSLDYAVAALAPVFIILMIGSLVAFLMTTLYQGEFPIRLMWILGLYTFASVLISRIAIEQSRSQSFVYLGLLGAATLFVAPRFFVIEGLLSAWSIPILVVFLLLITYLADRITYDCTAIDERGDAHGEGLLQSLGLLKKSRTNTKTADTKRKHNPGVWVLYFGLLALPVFGLGQLMIASSIGRRLAWIYIILYLLSALLLLVMISLLSVRRYARQRDLEMDAGLSMKWLAAGGLSIIGLVMLMSVLPLPSMDGGLWEPPFKITSRDNLQSHRWGWGSEQVKNDQQGNQQPGPSSQQAPQPGQSGPSGQQDPQSQPGQSGPSGQQGPQPQPGPSGPSGQQGPQPQPGQSGPSGQQGPQPQPGQSGPSGQQGPQSQPGQSSQSGQQGPQSQPGQSSQSGQQGPQPQPGQSGPSGQQGPQSQPGQSGQSGQQGPQSQPDPTGKQGPQSQPQSSSSPQPTNPPPSNSLPKIEWNPGASLRWLMLLVLVALALFFAIRYRREVVAWVRDFLAMVRGWFVRDEPAINAGALDTEERSERQPVRFLDLPNPFSVHAADPDGTVKALFEAACLWGREHRVERREDETPEEYVIRLGRKYSAIAEPLSRLGRVYSRLAYAQKRVPSSDIPPLRPLWEWMAQHPTRNAAANVILK